MTIQRCIYLLFMDTFNNEIVTYELSERLVTVTLNKLNHIRENTILHSGQEQLIHRNATVN